MALLSTLGLSIGPDLTSASLSYPELRLNLYNLHTTEYVNTVFWENGQYSIDGLQMINNLLRDHRTGDVMPIDPRLLSFVYLVLSLIHI